MEKKELSFRINVSLATLYNWEKTKPELIKLINLGINTEKGYSEQKGIEKYFKLLSEDEQEMYLAEIKARVLRKKIDK